VKRILVPCDFSIQSLNAFRFAIQLEKASKAEVHMLHVVELPILHDTVLMPVLSFEEDKLQDLRKNAESKFDQVVKKNAASEVRIKTKVEFGAPSRMILDYINKNDIDLVVMGTKGVTGMREIFIGSNTEKIVRASGVPVIAVKDDVRPREIRNIVFPNTIESDSHEDLVTRIKVLQHSLNAKLHIVYVNTPLNFKQDTVTRENLGRFVKRFMLKDCTVNIFNDMEEEAGIINFTRMIDADMIAIGTHGRKGLAYLLSGSLAEDLVNHSKLPIWTYSIKKEL
jgi:nucleotide-binding universal stress UspA family protein